MLQTISITVTGKVQGVFFRHSAKEKALMLGITGKVMNLQNGDVMIIATGTNEQLKAFTEWCRQGPPKAKVLSIKIIELPIQLFENFDIERF